MSPTVLSFRADEETILELDQLARATERDRQFHLQRALAHYLAAETRHLKAVAEGAADADAGNLIDIESVKARFISRV